MVMEVEYLVKLTLAVYRVTELFPKEDILRLQIRALANKILANFILFFDGGNRIYETVLAGGAQDEVLKNLELLESYFDLAEAQSLVDRRNFLVLSREYGKIKEFTKPNPVLAELASQAGAGGIAETNNAKENFLSSKITKERHKEILKTLEEKKKVKVGELAQVFPQVSRRTLIRDLEELNQVGAVERNGNGRGSHYNIKL